MTTSLRTRLGVAFNGLFLGCVIFFAVALAYNHVQLITHEYPLDYNEGGMLVTTQSLVNGENPYSVESQPAHISLYPILTNILVAPLARAFGNTFELHRVFSAVFIIACCAICYYLCRKESGRRTESFVAAALCYAAFLHYSTPVASTNSFGLFLFLAAIAIPWVQGFSTRSLAVSIVLGVLAFYTKQYFVACLGYVALYVFLAESKKRAIYYGLATTCIFIVGLAVVAYTSPYYFEATFFAVGAAYAEYSGNQFVNRQLIEYMQIYLPLLVILASMIVYSRYSQRLRIARAGKNIKSPLFVNLFDLDEPLLRLKPNYIWFCGACSLITFVLILGRNPGNHLTYLFQLISPFFIVGTFAFISDMPKARWPFRILIVLAAYNSYVMLPRDFSVKEEGWRTIRHEISQADDIYASTLVIEEAIARGSPLYISGGTRYFKFAGAQPAFLMKTNEQDRVPAVWERHVKRIQTKIQNKEFDLLLIDKLMSLPKSHLDHAIDTDTLLRANYEMTAVIRLHLMKRFGRGGYLVQIWKPIRAKYGARALQPRQVVCSRGGTHVPSDQVWSATL